MTPPSSWFGLGAGVLLAFVVVAGACSSRADGARTVGQGLGTDNGHGADNGHGRSEQPASSPTESPSSPSTPTVPGPSDEDGRRSPPPPAPGADRSTVRVDDPVGDPTGGRAPTVPDLVDLRSVTVTADEEVLRVDYELVEAPPLSRGPAVLNLVTFVDTTCDGTTDHELWATLTDRGWETSAYARTDGGAMGVRPSDHVDVRVSGDTVVVTAPAPDGATDFAWVAAAEDGLVADYKSGDTWRDVVPDSDAAHVGSCQPASP